MRRRKIKEVMVQDLLKLGLKIQAINTFCQQTSVDLLSAKKAIEAIETKMR